MGESRGEQRPTFKYARLERERRFLLEAPPQNLDVRRTLHISDRYLRGTRLRLRLVEEPGLPPVHKLGQKVPVDDAAPSTVAHTTIYLSRPEYEVLLELPAACIRKTRYVVRAGIVDMCIDVFSGPLAGLTLAEVDLGSGGSLGGGLPLLGQPVEVTDDRRFTGGALAATDAEELLALLADARRGGSTAP